MTTKSIREEFNLTQKELAEKYCIPLRTVENWDSRDCMPEYVCMAIRLAEVYQKKYLDLYLDVNC